MVSESRALLIHGSGLLHTVKPSPLNLCPDSRCVYSLSPPKVRAFAACWSHETLLFTHFLGARDFLWPGVFSTHGVMECHSSISTGSLWRLPAALSPHLAHARSSVPEFLLGPMQLWAGDHLAEIFVQYPAQGCSEIPTTS